MIPITFFYVNGIFLSDYFSIRFQTIFWVIPLTALILLFLFFHTLLNNNVRNEAARFFSWLFVALFFILAGISSYSFTNRQDKPVYEVSRFYSITVEEQLKPNSSQNRYYGTLIQDNKKHRVLIYQSVKDSIWQTGQTFISYVAVKPIHTAKNPYQFNYAAYLSKKNIYGQIKVDSVYKILPPQKDFYHYVAFVREQLKESFDLHGYDQEVRGIIYALLFGQRQDLSETVEKNYRDAGVVHVLSVSGLHIGLLYYVLNFILGLGIRNRNYRFLGVVSFLIFFAFLSGLSGPVVRSVVMFSLVGFGSMLRKNTSTIHILIVSMFFILLLYPNYVFDIGFQLSYMAVYAIIYLYPLIRKYFRKENKLLNFFSEMVAISLVAQLGVLPLSLYYFGQFPLLFLIGNLIVVTTTNLVLLGLLLLLALNYINEYLARYLGYVIEYLILFGNKVTEMIAAQHQWILTDISVKLTECIVYILLIFSVAWLLKKYTYKKIILLLILLISLQINYLIPYLKKGVTEQYVLYDYRNFTYVELSSDKYHFYTTDPDVQQQHYIKEFIREKGKKQIVIHHVENSFKNGNSLFLLVDSLGIYKTSQKADVIVLINNPAVNLDRLIEYHQPRQLIVHPGNKKWRKENWLTSCDKKNIPYHDMREKGYMTFNN